MLLLLAKRKFIRDDTKVSVFCSVILFVHVWFFDSNYMFILSSPLFVLISCALITVDVECEMREMNGVTPSMLCYVGIDYQK